MPAPAANWRIRDARHDEAPALLSAYEWLFATPGSQPPAWNADRACAALAAAIGGEDSAVILAEAAQGVLAEAAEGAVIGLISAYLDLDSVRYGRRCWVEDLAVDPEHRSKGIGRALLAAARAWAKQRGATHLELDTGLARVDAQRFYERERPSAKGYSYSWIL